MDEASLLDGIAPATRAEMDRLAVRRRYAAGESLFRQGEAPRELFLLLSGRVKAWRATEAGGAFTLILLGQDALLGSFGASSNEPWGLTATALTPVEVLAWRFEDVRRLMAADPGLGITLLETVSRHAVRMITRLEEVAGIAVEQRLARTLLRMVEGREGEGLDGQADELPLSRQDLADLVFSTLPTVSRTMSRWREAGLVDGGRGRVRVLDRAALRAVATAPPGDGGQG